MMPWELEERNKRWIKRELKEEEWVDE